MEMLSSSSFLPITPTRLRSFTTFRYRGQARRLFCKVRPRIAKLILLAIGASLVASGQNPTLKILHTFKGGTDGAFPTSSNLVVGGTKLFGASSFGGSCGLIAGCGTLFRIEFPDVETVIYSFPGSSAGSPDDPQSGVLSNDNSLVGATASGGFRYGTIFQLFFTGTEKVLYNFQGGTDGIRPVGELVQDQYFNLYRVTSMGGDFSFGTVFQTTLAGQTRILHSFAGPPHDGSLPLAGMFQTAARTSFGTTATGGDSESVCYFGPGCGTVFRLEFEGPETILHNFTGGADGGNPNSTLIGDPAGNLYGTTFSGGAGTCHNSTGCGVIFKIDATGRETTLYTFTGGRDGATPSGRLLRDKAGNLYGTAQGGGIISDMCPSGCGLLFKVEPTGTERVLYSFTGTDGAFPSSGLYARKLSDGTLALYGTTLGGGYLASALCGSFGCGTVFELTLPSSAEFEPN